MNDFHREPMVVAFISTEDSVTKKLKKKLREAGANLSNIITVDPATDREGMLRDFKFGSPLLAQFIRRFRPKVCVFDPLQGFIPADINMGARNAMRDCMAPLIGLGEECGTTFLIVAHTNKKRGMSGRNRLADSADLWDISRSVIMAGFTKDKDIRYLSQEKSNYGPLQKSMLYRVDDHGQIQYVGRTWKHDSDFVGEMFNTESSKEEAPTQEDCQDFIIETLLNEGGSIASSHLEKKMEDRNFSQATYRRARKFLVDEKRITTHPKEKGGSWYVFLARDGKEAEVKEDQFYPIPDDQEDEDFPFLD